MVTRILEDPVGVAKSLIDELWNRNLAGDKPDIFLLGRDQNDIEFGLGERGDIWLIEDDQERDPRASILRKCDDVRNPFKIEIHANTRERMEEIYKEILRIQSNNLTDPGRNLDTPDTTFDEWEFLSAPAFWQDRGAYYKIMNHEMLIHSQRIRD
jgi:hypothetical protein